MIHLATAEFQARRRTPRYRQSNFHRRDRALYHTDVEGTRRLVQEAEKIGVNHIIYLSRLGAEKASAYPVLRAKGLAEQILQRSDIPHTIIQAANLFGRGDHFLTSIIALARRSWPVVGLPGGGNGLVQPLWVEDLIKCLIIISDPLDLEGYRGRVYQLAGEERFRYFELVNLAMATAELSRYPLPMRNRLTRVLTWTFLMWRRRPYRNLYTLDRLLVPEIAPLNVIHQTFSFHPTRLRQQITYLRNATSGRSRRR